MEILKSRATIALIVMILGASYIGALDNSSLEDNTQNSANTITVNA